MVVDDDRTILEMLDRYLKSHGWDVVTCDSPFGVSAVVKRMKPDVVVLDVNMPALDGESIAKLLTKGSRGVPIPIVFYSAMPEDELRLLAARIPGASWVPKTSPLAVLQREIARVARPSRF